MKKENLVGTTSEFKQGDIVKIDFSPRKGHEQDGYRPAIVVSTEAFNKITNMIWVLPITGTMDDFPGHIVLETVNGIISGNILCEHIRSIDPVERKVRVVDKATSETIKKCKAIIEASTFI